MTAYYNENNLKAVAALRQLIQEQVIAPGFVDSRSIKGYAPAPDDAPRPNGSAFAGAIWLQCHDGKARRAKPGIPMLVDGMAGRSDLWSLAGNSICAPLATEVIAAFLDAERSAASVLIPPPY